MLNVIINDLHFFQMIIFFSLTNKCANFFSVIYQDAACVKSYMDYVQMSEEETLLRGRGNARAFN
jgi:hypothetical protein